MRLHQSLIAIACILYAGCQQFVGFYPIPGSKESSVSMTPAYPLQLLWVQDSELIATEPYLQDQIQSTSEYVATASPFYFTTVANITVPLPRLTSFSNQWASWQQRVGDIATQKDLVVLFIVPESAVRNAQSAEGYVGYAESRGADFQHHAVFAMVVYSSRPEILQYRILHELGHLFGASHARTGSMAIDDTYTTYSDESLIEMRSHRETMSLASQSFRSQSK